MVMIKKVLLISVLIILYFNNIESMNGVASMPTAEKRFNISQPLNDWKKISPLTEKEMRIYNKTWDYRATLYRNKVNLADIFCDTCCDFSFKIIRKENNIVYGRSISNPNMIFLEDFTSTSLFIRKDADRYAVTNFLDNIGEPREFTYDMKEQIRKLIRDLTENPVGCKLLRIATAKIVAGKLPKLIFVPLQKDTEIVVDDGMNIYFGKYGWQIESDKFMSRIQMACSLQQKISGVKKQVFDFQKYAAMKLPNYRYILFSPENFFNRPVVAAIRRLGQKFELFHVELPPDVTFFRTVVSSLFSQKSDSQVNIKARLNLKQKNFSQKLNQKFNNVLKIMAEADCVTEQLNPQIFGQIRKLGGIRNYAEHFVDTMSRSAKLKRIESFILACYGNDENLHIQYGLSSSGFDALNESSYLSHRYHWIRAFNMIGPKRFADIYETFIQELGDFDLYSHYLSPNSSIKFPKFGVNQYKCADNPNLTEEERGNRSNREKKTNKVRLLLPQSNERSGGFCKI